MSIAKINTEEAERHLAEGAHLLTYAETGFAPLTIFGHRLLGEAALRHLSAFEDAVNDNSELGTLLPQADISAVPRNSIRGPQERLLSAHLRDFGELYRQHITSGDVVVDFFIGRHADHVEDALEETFGAEGPFRDIAVFWRYE